MRTQLALVFGMCALCANGCNGRDDAASGGDPDGGGDSDVVDPCDPIVDENPPRAVDWVTVPAGSFDMGCSMADEQCFDCEYPTHAVAISAFEITATEITQDQYETVTGENPSRFAPCANCPVEEVPWQLALDFCVALGGRLPSEAEWEYAARGGSTSGYGCGEDAACLNHIGWYSSNACHKTHLVASKAANGFGLYDTQGNVWEWVSECWHDDYNGAPDNGDVWEGGDCTYRILRGGAFGVDARGLRVSNRDGDYVDGYLVPSPGFRCARDG